MSTAAAFAQKHYGKLLALAVFVLFWQSLVTVFGVKPFIIPSPQKTLAALLDPRIAAKYNWPLHIGATVAAVVVSFCVTAAAGVLLALLITWSTTARRVITPVLTLLNSLPKIAFAPLFLLWLGYGLVPNIIIATLVAFFPVIINTATGLAAVEQDLLDLVHYLHASKAQVFAKIRIPNSLPYIFSGFRISSTLCVVGTIVGEFVASDRGLGYLLKDSQAMIDTPPMFASLILISIFGLGLYGAVSVLTKLAMPWQSDGQGS